MSSEIFEWRCPDCGKEIRSLHRGQFEYNKKEHIKTHKKKKVKNNEIK